MAKASETLEHPVLGSLGWLTEYSHWFTQYRMPSGEWLDVIVEPGDGDRYEFIEPAAKLFQWALDNERRILRDAMQVELLELYNGTWRRDDEPILSEEELMAKLRWELLRISADDVLPVEFSYHADDFFGGHIVSIEVDEEMKFRDIDLRG